MEYLVLKLLIGICKISGNAAIKLAGNGYFEIVVNVPPKYYF